MRDGQYPPASVAAHRRASAKEFVLIPPFNIIHKVAVAHQRELHARYADRRGGGEGWAESPEEGSGSVLVRGLRVVQRVARGLGARALGPGTTRRTAQG